MHEKRLWPNLVFVLFGLLGCVVIWQTILSPSSSSGNFHLNTVYTLYTQNSTGFIYPMHQLPVTDYNQLIDLNFSFTILNLVCNESSPLLLVLIHSSPENFSKRKTIRETWGKGSDNVKILFMIGSVNSSDLQKTLEDENTIYNDFIQGSFLDTYRNITYKHVMVFKYVIYHCSKARYILKTDDDVFVNMPAMKNFLTVDLSPYGATRMLLCTPRKHTKVPRTYRSKWRVSFTEYPNRSYPTYCPASRSELQ
ncbi:hypothetical protein NQ318_003158 [Aromia moschata]|uniref:Hexosyltransferase n=1 Tax=Aromia moschata TaxID=1265417 RepID=A0AAV8XGE3_9CUCU|nr:hypothetical protein NQ318_003158 [Aromia moschata]